MTSRLSPALFAAPYGGNGTLGAIRDLGRSGVPIRAPRAPWTSPARFSRFVTETVQPFSDSLSLPDQLAWLIGQGRRHPGSVLMPGLDGLTWLAAAHQDELRSWFQLYLPPGDAIYALLNKERLYYSAAAAGLESPKSWFPASLEDLRRLSRELEYPVIVKPRTHIGSDAWFKGKKAGNAAELVAAYTQISARTMDPVVLARDPEAGVPFIQEYLAAAASRIYNLYGFIDDARGLSALDASWKVLQYPRRLGVGVCFVAAKVDPEVAGQIRELARQTGFFGIFEAEFIRVRGRLLLIDFNPRVFNSISLPAARGLRLAYLWYQAAQGNWPEVEREVHKFAASGPPANAPRRWRHRFALEVMVATRLSTLRMGPREAHRWWTWMRDSAGDTIDAVGDSSDPWPGRLNGVQHLASFIRDPKYFLGTFVRD